MAFKTVNTAKAEKRAGKFVLENDGDSAEVIFLYRSSEDMLVANTHYIKTNDYSGYVHCNEGGCAACAKNLRVQEKLFIPMYVISINGQSVNEIRFWDRNMRFEPVLSQAIFKNYANPSEFIFRVTRNGVHGSKETTYGIQVAFKNTSLPFDKIMADNGATFPEYYEHIVKEVPNVTLSQWLASANSANAVANADIPEYVPTPRVSVASANNGLDTLNALVDVEDEFTDDADTADTTENIDELPEF